MIKKIKHILHDWYTSFVSWATYTFEQWFWKDAIIQRPKKGYRIDDDHRHFSEKWDDDEEILGI